MSKYSLTFEKKNISTTFLKVSFIKKKHLTLPQLYR